LDIGFWDLKKSNALENQKAVSFPASEFWVHLAFWTFQKLVIQKLPEAQANRAKI